MPDGKTRQDILATALHLFRTQGYDATSLRQIADRLGFTKAALYYHFPAKDHLVIELARPWLEAVSALVTRYEDGPSARPVSLTERRQQLVADYVDALIAHHAVIAFLSQDAAAQKHPDVGRRARTLVLALQDELAGTESNDEVRTRVACALGAVHALALLDAATLPAAREIVIEVVNSVLAGADDRARSDIG